jgi:hypothetical protein
MACLKHISEESFRGSSVVWIAVAAERCQYGFNISSIDPLNPLGTPGWRVEGIGEVLCLMHYLAVAELHNAHCICWSPLIVDCVFRDPKITVPENSSDVEA